MQDYITAQDDTIIEFAFTGNGCLDTGYAVIANLNIVADMYFVHQEVFITDAGCITGKCGTTDHYILTDMIIVTDNQATVFTV